MKILFLSPVLPWPLKSGGQIRVFHLVKALQKENDVTLVAYIRRKDEEEFLPELQKICSKVLLIKRDSRPWAFKSLVRSLFSSKPLVVNLYEDKNDLSNLANSADLVWAECFYLMDKIKTNIPVILGEQNIEYLAYRRYFQNLVGWKKVLLWLPMEWDLIKMKYWEKKMWKTAKKIAAVSQTDKEIIEKETGRDDISVIPNGVDTAGFTVPDRLADKKTVLFVGEYKWFPNKEAINWLIKEIFPEIRKKMPEAELLIVGRHFPDWLKRLGESGRIRVDQGIEDIRVAYEKAAVFLAPLRSGGGTKYKILEAMAMGVPVVTTKVGAEGLGGQEGEERNMIVKNSTNDLTEAVIDILGNREKYQEMTKKARKFVSENFDWKVIEKKINEVIEVTK